jgi:predicted Zn-dependent protease
MRALGASTGGEELTEERAREIVAGVLKASGADETVVTISGRTGGNLRFARNGATTSGEMMNLTVTIAATSGRKTGTSQVNEAGAGALRAAVRRAEEIARLSPEDPEHMPPLPPQRYPAIAAAHVPATARFGAAERARAAEDAIGAAAGRDTVIAGFLENGEVAEATGNSAGNFGFHRRTWLDYSNTVRTPEGRGSGWAATFLADSRRLDASSEARVAAEKALASREPRPLEPGVYPVILEPSAVGSLVGMLLFNMDARNADEGRSFLSAPGEKTRLGEQVLSEKVTIVTDPASPLAPGGAWGAGGVPARKIAWFDRGVVASLDYDRYWAEKQGKEPTPGPLNALMEGEDRSLEELIQATDRGVLVTRFWYIRSVDPRTLLHTGLTRDGTFWVEEGKLRHAVNNFRWNDSAVSVLKEIEMLSRPVPVGDVEYGITPMVLPAVKSPAFTFSSVSQAV